MAVIPVVAWMICSPKPDMRVGQRLPIGQARPDELHDLRRFGELGVMGAVVGVDLREIDDLHLEVRELSLVRLGLRIDGAEACNVAPDAAGHRERPVILRNEEREVRMRLAHLLDLHAEHVDVDDPATPS